MRKISLLFLLVVFSLFAVETSFYTNTNRLLFVSPTYSALGGSNIAISAEPLPISNPSAIILSESKQVFVGYTNYFKNSHNSTLASVIVPLSDKQSVAISLGYLYVPVDSVSAQVDENGVPYDYTIKTKTSSELYFNAYYAHKILSYRIGDLSVGGSFHVNRRRLIDWTGYGVGLDVGVLNQFKNGVSVSLHVNDITTQFMRWSGSYKELGKPICFGALGYEVGKKNRFNVTYKTPDLFGNSGLARTSRGDSVFDDEVDYVSVREKPSTLFSHGSYGVAGVFNEKVTLRAGFSDARKLSFGGGVTLFERLGLDFAYAHQRDLGGTYTVASTYQFK